MWARGAPPLSKLRSYVTKFTRYARGSTKNGVTSGQETGVTLCEMRDGRIVPSRERVGQRNAWKDVPVTEAEVLPGGRVALILPLAKLSVLVGYLEVFMADPERYQRFHKYITQEEAEALADDLWQAYEDLSRELARRESTVEKDSEGGEE